MTHYAFKWSLCHSTDLNTTNIQIKSSYEARIVAKNQIIDYLFQNFNSSQLTSKLHTRVT